MACRFGLTRREWVAIGTDSDGPIELLTGSRLSVEKVRRQKQRGMVDMANPRKDSVAFPWPTMLVSLAVGLLVFAIACKLAYQQYCGSAVRYRQASTLRDIAELRQAIETYRREKHVLPKALSDLPQAWVRHDVNGAPVDSWHRLLHYWTDGTRYRIFSYGRDGKPGGVGLDYDLSSDDLGQGRVAGSGGAVVKSLPEEARPTFGQFVTDRGEYGGSGSGISMFLTCILTGAAASLLAWRSIRRGARLHWNRGLLVLKLGVTVLATLVIGLFITGLHIPSGH